MIRKIEAEASGGMNDCAAFVAKLCGQPGMFRKFIFVEDSTLSAAFWATQEQNELALRFGSLIVVDTTFNTNK